VTVIRAAMRKKQRPSFRDHEHAAMVSRPLGSETP
jgi:hypothetical protein